MSKRMDSSKLEAGGTRGYVPREPLNHRLQCDGPDTLLGSNARTTPLRSTGPNTYFNRGGPDALVELGPSSTDHILSHCDELRQLESGDLIQLNSRPPTPHDVQVRRPSAVNPVSVQPRYNPRLAAEPSLLDDEDPPFLGKIAEQHASSDVQQSQNNEQTDKLIDTRVPIQSTSRQNSGDQSCVQCKRYDTDRDYCNVCDMFFCTRCWEQQMVHKLQRKAPGSIPHEKTDYRIARKIKATLEAKTTHTEQEKLHEADEDTNWFGVVREDAELPTFRDYGRYAGILANTLIPSTPNGSDWTVGVRDHRFPSLVSFVGQTGAGKSAIIKLIIDLSTKDRVRFPSPVVGAQGLDLPTSSDVHLYSDPQTSKSNNPILYADCEGLEGGEREPLGAIRKRKDKSSKIGRVDSFEKRMQKFHHTSEREITWADTNAKRSREFAVTHLYPRLLYTFSDVVVFVLKNPRVIESVFEKLVTWAAAALEKSSNQPVLPHAIIVLNASENDLDPEQWDIATSTSRLLENLSKAVFQNATFKKYRQFWRERHRPIETVEQLLHSYYRSVNVVRIPTSGRPNLIRTQVEKLYTYITVACDIARERKAELRMLLDADELQPYLHYAFDHFACDLDSPFDFVQASFTNSPIPLDFGGNILKLAINLMNVWENAADGQTIFTELSYMVASCIMLDSARSKIRGTAKQIYPQYIDHLDDALENFCDRHWPCEYVKSGGGARCVNVRSGHGSKGHQLKNGKVFAVGGYVSSFSFNDYRHKFQVDVYSRLEELLGRLRSRVQEGAAFEAQAAAEIHKEEVLVQFYNHSARGRPEAFISHSTCFSCLFEPPEHALPCGHILCTSCLRAYGHSRGRTLVEIGGCPLESSNRRSRHGFWRVFLKPDAAGIRILTLDGGGIRGIVELETLRQIEKAMGGRLAIQCFFDLIVGTSTGGLIALGLAAKDWSVEQCTRHFEDLCKQAFTRRTGGNVPGIGWVVDNYNHSKYKTRPLQEALISAYSENEYLFGGSRPHASYGTDVKVAVTATSASGSAVVLANYNRLCGDKLPYHFQRPEGLASELKIWEAARATSAAPRMFKPLCHRPSKQVYTDGAIYHNNPIQVADRERKLIWPDLENEYPDLIVSLGTTYKSAAHLSPQNVALPRLGIFSHGRVLYKIAVDHIASALDSEKAWHAYMNVLQPPSSHRAKFIRFNPQLSEDPPHLDDVEHMSSIQKVVCDMSSSDDRILKVALRLIASSFYFEKSHSVELAPDGRVQIRGNFHCRLLEDSKEIRELGKLLQRKTRPGQDLFFVIQEEHHGRYAKKACITTDVIERMVRKSQFKMSSIRLELSNQFATSEILLHFGDDDVYPISRFPRSLVQEDDSRIKTRPSAAVNSNRWASRTLSQQSSRESWVPHHLLAQRQDIRRISLYSKEDYVIGETSQDVLRNIANRLNNGPSPAGALIELDSSSLETEMAVLSRQRSERSEGWGSLGTGELEDNATPMARVPPVEPMSIPIYELDLNPPPLAELQSNLGERGELEGSIPGLATQMPFPTFRQRSSNEDDLELSFTQSPDRSSLASRVSRVKHRLNSIPSIRTSSAPNSMKGSSSPLSPFRKTARHSPSSDGSSPGLKEDGISLGNAETAIHDESNVSSSRLEPASPARGSVWARMTGKK